MRWKHEEARRYLLGKPSAHSKLRIRIAVEVEVELFPQRVQRGETSRSSVEDEFRPRGVQPPVVGGSPPISFGRIDLSAGNGDRRICAGRIENKISSVIDTNGVVVWRNQIPEDAAAFPQRRLALGAIIGSSVSLSGTEAVFRLTRAALARDALGRTLAVKGAFARAFAVCPGKIREQRRNLPGVSRRENQLATW